MLITIISIVVSLIIIATAVFAIAKGRKFDKVIDLAKILGEKALKSEDITELKDNIRNGYLNGEYDEALKEILENLVKQFKKE